MLKVCKNCGKEFTPATGKQKYCSPECTKAYWARRKREEYTPRPARAAKICLKCGASFVPNSPNQKYCSKECHYICWRNQEYKRRGIKQHSGTVKICLNCGREFTPSHGLQKHCSVECTKAYCVKRRSERRKAARIQNVNPKVTTAKPKKPKLKKAFKLTPEQIAQRERFKEILLARRVERGIGDDFLYADS